VEPDKKIRVGGKDYTQAELEAKLAERAAPVPAAPAPTAPPAPAAEPPLTPEQISEREIAWMTKFAADEKLSFSPTEAEIETILAGGKEAAELFGKKMTDMAAKTVLLARKSLWADSVQPLFDRQAQLEQLLQPLLVNNQSLEAHAAETQFLTAHPEFKTHIETVRQVVNALAQNYPKEFLGMTREQQIAEVAAQSDRILSDEFKRWNPNGGSWRDALKTAPATPAIPPAAPPAAPPVVPPAAPVVPPVRPPAANSPAATPAGGKGNQTKDWHKATAKSLVD
jgi:hypothetical protein